MATTATPYGQFFYNLGQGNIDLAGDSLSVMLLSSSYTPSVDNDGTVGTVSAYEITGTGYTAGGEQLANTQFGYDAAQDASVLTSDPVTWTALTATFRYAVVCNQSGSLVGFYDFGENRTYTGEDFQLTFPNGVLRIRKAV